jgi:hypothetical protein
MWDSQVNLIAYFTYAKGFGRQIKDFAGCKNWLLFPVICEGIKNASFFGNVAVAKDF